MGGVSTQVFVRDKSTMRDELVVMGTVAHGPGLALEKISEAIDGFV